MLNTQMVNSPFSALIALIQPGDISEHSEKEIQAIARKCGKNMRPLLTFFVRYKGWHNISGERMDQSAASSLVKMGLFVKSEDGRYCVTDTGRRVAATWMYPGRYNA